MQLINPLKPVLIWAAIHASIVPNQHSVLRDKPTVLEQIRQRFRDCRLIARKQKPRSTGVPAHTTFCAQMGLKFGNSIRCLRQLFFRQGFDYFSRTHLSTRSIPVSISSHRDIQKDDAKPRNNQYGYAQHPLCDSHEADHLTLAKNKKRAGDRRHQKSY
ncbi:hypothetical protein [Caballeronia sp. dw_276]|uniref:hypothetical protein n=1 Tax=Caballeronia sp. dw_276 TaxID=2719795 RepID=UPI0021074044|nr:hypothetical protein [Caballeronia sp. dw_276]